MLNKNPPHRSDHMPGALGPMAVGVWKAPSPQDPVLSTVFFTRRFLFKKAMFGSFLDRSCITGHAGGFLGAALPAAIRGCERSDNRIPQQYMSVVRARAIDGDVRVGGARAHGARSEAHRPVPACLQKQGKVNG